MMRSVAAIKLALAMAAPNFEARTEAAQMLQSLAVHYDFDPLTEVAVVENESRWNPDAVNPTSGARGLGGIMPSNFPSCREDPNGYDCSRLILALDDWRSSLRITAKLFATWREYCRTTVGSARAAHWLQGYQGFDATRATTCGHRKVRGRWVAAPVPALTQRILARRAELARRVS